MTVAVQNFTTGPATLPDVGTLSYNGCTFSPLFQTDVSGLAVKDSAGRTTKFIEYSITADGYVTAPEPPRVDGIAPTMETLYQLLTAQGGSLTYEGRAADIVVNPAGGGGLSDVAWGPIPEVLDFQPLGGGNSAKVKWQVKTRVPKVPNSLAQKPGLNNPVLLQFNYETSVGYGEDGYSSLSVRGTMEIPLTRTSQGTRTVPYTVDDFRSQVQTRILRGIDLSRFHLSRREFSVSRDKRTMEFDVQAEEKSYQDLPPDCTVARGTYSVRPARAGGGLCMWLCTLRATYTVAVGRPRRVAWFAFLALLREKMRQAALGNLDINGNPAFGVRLAPNWNSPAYPAGADASVRFWQGFLRAQHATIRNGDVTQKAFLLDFSFDEGTYLDSKTTSFSATFRIATTFDLILKASGLWKKVPEEDFRGNNLWSTSVKNIMGTQSWLVNPLDPKLDVIVDFGGP